MESINPAINEIHQVFCESLGYQVPLRERQWYDALEMGMTSDDVKLVIRSRKERIKAGVRHDECLLLRNFIGNEDAIADVIEEAAMLRARIRVKVFSPAKREVLRAAGRSDEPEQGNAVPMSEVIAAMRKSVG